jgi:two-component system LytT family sensor kinase
MFSIRYRYFLAVFLGIYSSLNVLYTGGEKLFDFSIPFWILLLVLSLIVTGIWELNRLAETKIISRVTALGIRIHPLILLFLISLVSVTVVCIVALQLIYPLLQMDSQFNISHLRLLLAFGFRVNLFMHCVNAIVFYMNRAKKIQVEAEQFKKISIEARFEALRAQINPHFLFNCFNVLSTLVYKDADTSANFINQLSRVYRYLLFNQEKKVVSLEDEISFLDSYLYLIKIRFGENIVIDQHIETSARNLYVAPAVVQMLIENAIKHNIISRKKPLSISVIASGTSLVVQNTLQQKELQEPSSGLGLQNIKSRYLFLSEDPVVIEKTPSEFRVTIPLLQHER